jgi:hypothetical protein
MSFLMCFEETQPMDDDDYDDDVDGMNHSLTLSLSKICVFRFVC